MLSTVSRMQKAPISVSVIGIFLVVKEIAHYLRLRSIVRYALYKIIKIN